MDDGRSDIAKHLSFLHDVYELKRKRIRFMQLASVDNELKSLSDTYYKIWEKTAKGFILKDAQQYAKSIDIIKGLFGMHDEIMTIMRGNKAILAIDRMRFYQYIVRHVANSTAIHYLYNIFYGRENLSIEQLAKSQLPYLERYLPTFKKFDKADNLTSVLLTQFDVQNLWSIIEIYDAIRDNLISDTRLHKQFVNDFTKLYREELSLKILGYGEISTVMQAMHGSSIDRSFAQVKVQQSDWVWKRMPPVDTIEDVTALQRAYHEYREILVEKIGIQVPLQQFKYFDNGGWFTVYAGQKKINPQMVGNVMIKRLDKHNAAALFNKILSELRKWHNFNMSDSSLKAGIDGQISNWVVTSKEGALTHVGTSDTLQFIDTSTPLYRINGTEQLNAEVFLKNTPRFLRAIIRALFLQGVLDRYYDLRAVVIDCIANLYKEKREDLIPSFIISANYFFSTLDEAIKPVTVHEVAQYYKGDAFIWRLFQTARRVDKFITETILRKKYMYRLPAKIDR